jgi:hypothetical protein
VLRRTPHPDRSNTPYIAWEPKIPVQTCHDSCAIVTDLFRLQPQITV